MLRKRIPVKRIFLDPEEKQELIKLGEPIGSGLKHVISIVSYASLLRWKRKSTSGEEPKKMGRPRTIETLRDLIVKLAAETGWGYTRIMGELKKLGIKPPSRNTVKKIMKEAGHEPGPDTGKGSWAEFVKVNAATLYQCDFFSKMIWTPTGMRQYFVLAFIHVDSRTVFVSKCSRKPDSAWMKEQAEAFVEHVETTGRKCETLIHDMDNMFVTDFDDTIENSGAEVKEVGPRAPNMNVYIERWVQSIQQECLDHFIVFGEDHFDYLVSEYVDYYQTVRPHQSLENKPLTGDWPDPTSGEPPDGEIVCHSRLGGLLKHYERQAA
jgi:Integrase core domain